MIDDNIETGTFEVPYVHALMKKYRCNSFKVAQENGIRRFAFYCDDNFITMGTLAELTEETHKPQFKIK